MRSKFEIRANKELKSKGYRVDYKARPSFVIKGYNVDYFNLFDLIAYKENEPLRWISIKPASNTPVKHQQAIKNFIMPQGNQKEIWRYDRNPKNKRLIRVRKKVVD